MNRYARWGNTTQGAIVVSMLFFLLALINVATGGWLLAAVFASVGAVNLLRTWRRIQAERAAR